MKKSFLLYLTLPFILVFQGCRDDFATINTPPDKITEPQINHLFTEALASLFPHSYLEWFYNYSKYYLTWSQATVAVYGNRAELNLAGDYSSPEDKLFAPKLHLESIRYQLNRIYTPEEAAIFRYIEAVCNPILVYLGMYGTDFYGSVAYSDASKALFTSPALITPAYQNQQELFDVWLGELDETITVLTNPVTIGGREYRQASPGKQDFIYGGDYAKWARFANALKLKIAVRMIHADKARALQIAQEVAQSAAGYMDDPEDDLIYNRGSEFYGSELPAENLGTGSLSLIDFLVENRDPRVRFLFAKNDFNSQVVQAFFDAGKDIPSYIIHQMEYHTDSEGKKAFIAWKTPGEPWVRYYGAPVDIQAVRDPAINNAYFNRENFRLGDKSYQPLSLYNEEMTRGNTVYTFPSPPGSAVFQDNTAYPFHSALCSAAETNLYLAELKLLGADLPQSADYYFRRGVELSVRLYDRLAWLNKIPYYEAHTGFDPLDATIALQEDEITPLLTKYALTGSAGEQLEQVYLQQYIHHIYSPNELWVTVRRSGYPRKGSSLIAWAEFNSLDASYPVPRRLPLPIPTPTDPMYSIKTAACISQGFTTGVNTPQVLNAQRVWYDKNAPEYGGGNFP